MKSTEWRELLWTTVKKVESQRVQEVEGSNQFQVDARQGKYGIEVTFGEEHDLFTGIIRCFFEGYPLVTVIFDLTNDFSYTEEPIEFDDTTNHSLVNLCNTEFGLLARACKYTFQEVELEEV